MLERLVQNASFWGFVLALFRAKCRRSRANFAKSLRLSNLEQFRPSYTYSVTDDLSEINSDQAQSSYERKAI